MYIPIFLSWKGPGVNNRIVQFEKGVNIILTIIVTWIFHIEIEVSLLTLNLDEIFCVLNVPQCKLCIPIPEIWLLFSRYEQNLRMALVEQV